MKLSSSKIRKALKIPAVIVAFFAGGTLIQYILLLGFDLSYEGGAINLFVIVVLVGGLFFGYIVGNLMEGERVSDIFKKVSSPPNLSRAQMQPWARFWARWIDVMIFAFCTTILLVIMIVVLGESFPMEIFEPNDVLLGMLVLIAYTLFEPVLLSSWGTTPGKALFKITLRRVDGEKLSYQESFFRSLRVWFFGLGVGYPLISLITMLVAYQRLKKRKITSWDEHGKFVVKHGRLGTGRLIAVILVIAVTLGLGIANITLQAE